jgi:hypothetical protein
MPPALRAGIVPASEIMRHFVGQKFYSDKSAQADVFGLVHNAHATAAEFFHYAVVQNSPADEGNGACH